MSTSHPQETCVVTALTLLGLLAAPIRGEDWPQWRGPNRDGVWSETGIMESFPVDGLKIRWRAPVAWGWSSPVIAQGRVFVTDVQVMRSAVKERVHCFDAATGKSLWTYSYDVNYPEWVFVPGQEPGVTPTPIVDAGKLYTVGANGHVHCFDPAKGELLWQMDLGKEYVIKDVACRASPLIDRDLLIVFTGATPGAGVVALDKNSGKEIWKALDESVSNSSPVIITAGGKKQLIVWTLESVTSLAPETGVTYWRHELKTINDYAVSTPICQNNLLLVSGLMLELDADKPAASVLWPNSNAVSRRILSNTSTAMFRGEHVFSARSSGEWVCLVARTGEQVWASDKVTELKNGASIHMTANGDAVFLFTDEGELIKAELTAQGYKEISRSHLLEPTYKFGGHKMAWTPPAFANRHVFARSDKEVICVSLAAERYRHPENGGRFTASAALLASVVLTALHPERFVDFRHKRWEDLAIRLDSDHPASGSGEYGRRLLWAGSFAQEVSMTPTFQRFWSTGEPLWVVSGICWDAMTPHGMKRLRKERSGDDDAEREYNEGKQRMRWHRDRERSQAVVNRAKSLRLKNDPLLRCEACGFSFVETYGDLGNEFVEAHHKVPLAKLEIGTKTKVEDLAMVCANCHRMLHRDDDTLSIEQLKVILTSLDPERLDI